MADLIWAKQRKMLRSPKVGYNAEVFHHFRDEELSQNRANLRDFCLIGAKDSRLVATSKMQFFYERVLKLQYRPTVVGHFKDNFDALVSYRCRIELYFEQHHDSLVIGDSPITAQMGFRLQETNSSISEAKLFSIAERIKSSFGGHPPYSWDKGKYICWYKDIEHGYDFQVYALNESEGESVIRKVVSMNEHPYHEENFRVTKPNKNSVNSPSNQTILGKNYKKPKWRPTIKVYFKYAICTINGLPNPVTLLDYSGTMPNPILSIL